MLTIFAVSSIIDALDERSAIRIAFRGSTTEFIIRCFSLKRNSRVIFSVAQDGKFKSLEGLRAILTYYVVLLHTYEFGLAFMYNKNHYHSGSYKMVEDYRNMVLPNILLMDNFFLISGTFFFKPRWQSNNNIFSIFTGQFDAVKNGEQWRKIQLFAIYFVQVK